MSVIKRERFLVSMHIPKVAGTSFRKILKNNFHDGLLGDYGPKHPSYQRFASHDLMSSEALMRQGVYCLHGHFRMRKYKHFDADFITWLRNPLTIIPSTYFYLSSKYPGHRKLPKNNCTLLEFIEHSLNQNLMSNHFSGCDIEMFEFIGLMEEYDKSLEILCSKLHLDKPKKEIFENQNTDNKNGYDLSTEEKECILYYNQKDIKLYSEVKKKWF